MKKKIIALILAGLMVMMAVPSIFAGETKSSDDKYVWIKAGTTVYKGKSENSQSEVVDYPHLVKVEKEDGEWMQFSWIDITGAIWLHGYKYVKVENTSVDEPTDEPETPEVPDEPEEDEVIEEIDDSVKSVDFSGGENLTVEVAAKEIAHVLKSVPESSDKHNTVWRGVYDIEADAGTEITVSGLPEIGSKTVEIRHYLDDAEAIRAAIANGSAKYLCVAGREEDFSAEIASLKEVVADSDECEICYVVLSSDDGQVTVNEDNSISFLADSYSYYEIGVVYISPTAFVNAAPFDKTPVVENEGVESSKSVIYDEATGTYKLVLESYVTGSTTTVTAVSTKATDFVISLDTSHSMDECINCGGADTDSTSTGAVGSYTRCPIYAPDLDITATYYRGTSSGNPVIYCSDCKGWFADTHWKEDGTHGSIDDIRYLPWENAKDKDRTIARIGDTTFYREVEHEHTDECADDCATVVRVPVYSLDADFSTDEAYYIDSNVSHTSRKYIVKYCDICEKWFSGYHCGNGTSRIPKESASDKTSGRIAFYEDHVCTDECAEECELIGTRVAVYTSDPGFSTDKTYFRDANVSHTSVGYVVEYCDEHGAWYSNGHGHSASTGTKEIPYERGTYGKTTYDLFHVPCISLLNGAKAAIEAFVDSVYEMSKGPDEIAGTEDDVRHRIALTGFSGEPTGTTNGRTSIDYRPHKDSWDSWTRSGIFSVWNPNLTEDEKSKFYPNEGFDDTIATQNFVSYWAIDGTGGNATQNATEVARAEYFYSHSLRDVTSEAEMAVLDEGMEDYNYEYGTMTEYGIIMADNIFKHNSDPDRNRVLVLFTDGEPHSSADALAAVNKIKNNDEYKATVYGIGTFSKASAQDIFPLPSLSTNKFMTLMSSNYKTNKDSTNNAAGKKYSENDVNDDLWLKDAEGNYVINAKGKRVFNVWRTDENYEYVLDADGNKIPRADKGAYYLTADDGASLIKAFENVAQSSTTGGAQIELSSSTVVQDVMSAEWVVDVVDDEREIEAYTMTYIGNTVEDGKNKKQWIRQTEENGGELIAPDGLTVTTEPVKVKETVIVDGVGVEREVDRDAVQVTGFDFTQYYVGIDKSTVDGNTTETPRGKKLVVEIPVKPSASNNGGKGLSTNYTEKSGIIVENTFIENFDSPAVDLPVNVTFQKILENGDSGQSFTFNMGWKSFAGYDEDDNAVSNANYLKAEEQDKNLTFVTKPESTTTFANLVEGTVMTITEQVDTNYMVEVSIDGGQTFLTAPQEVGFVTDAVVDTEDEIEDEDSITEESVPENENGENGDVEDGDEDIEDEIVEPQYSLKLTRNVDGTVTAEVNVTAEMGIVFRNTLLLTDLTITKNLNVAAQEDQAFIFNVKGSDLNTEGYSVDIVLIVPKGSTIGTATIKDVLIGEYTVAENQEWAWRYELADNNSETLTQTVGINDERNEFSFTNAFTNKYWLGGDCYMPNHWN